MRGRCVNQTRFSRCAQIPNYTTPAKSVCVFRHSNVLSGETETNMISTIQMEKLRPRGVITFSYYIVVQIPTAT